MPDRPTLPEPISDQGAARFRADLAAYLNSMFLHEPAELLGELSEPTRVALMDELSEHGPACAKIPEDWPQLPRWSLREQLADRRSARRPPSPEQLRPWRAEALRARAISRDSAQQHQLRKEPSPGRPPRARDWPGQDRGHGRDHP